MAKTITIIGLLNKIYNKEELPKIIKYQDTIFTLQDNYVYTASDGVDRLLDHIKYDFSSVRETVEIIEIIEEKQDIDIQEIEEIKFRESDKEYLGFGVDLAHSKINELVQAVKQLDRNIKDKE